MRDNNARSATIRGYMESINILFELRNLPIPSNFRDVDNMNVKLFAAIEVPYHINNNIDINEWVKMSASLHNYAAT